MTDKLFTHAGVSRLKGQYKARFATDSGRVKVLIKTGHDNIDIVQLPEPMTKVAAIEYLISINFDDGRAEIRAALEDGLARRTKTQKKSESVAA